MDIPRPDQSKAKRKKRIIYGSIAVLVLAGITVLLARLKPAAPTVDRNLVWVGEVKRGEMIRNVRGLGTLVPEDITWIAARTQARVDKIIIRPGTPVKPGTLILEMTNPDLVSNVANADSQLRAAEAQLSSLRTQLESTLLQSEATAAAAKSNYETSKLQAEVKEQLFKEGLVSELELKLAQATAAQAEISNDIEQKRYKFAQESIKPQLAVQEAEVERLRDQAKLRHEELDALQVRSNMTGVLSALGTPTQPIEVGAQVQPGTNLVRVADPTKLKAEIRIAETQAKDIAIGQKAQIDTRNGIVDGVVSRIEPAVQNGTVTVDVHITGDLSGTGARPDLSVDGTIELERLNNVVYVSRPAFGQENSTVGIFKLDADGTYASRVQVKLGRSSVNTIEVMSGLVPGDRVILSDMSPYDSNDRIKLD